VSGARESAVGAAATGAAATGAAAAAAREADGAAPRATARRGRGRAKREPGGGSAGEAEPGAFARLLRGIPADGGPDGGAYARAVDLELSPPQPSVARSLRLVPGQPAVSVTIRFDDAATREPAGLTVVILRPELFRVVIQAGDTPSPEISPEVIAAEIAAPDPAGLSES
jgi:hypothetical protein